MAVLRLPAGNYELYDWKVVVPNPYGWDQFGPQRAMAYRFSIATGRATYLGNVDLSLTDQDKYAITVDGGTSHFLRRSCLPSNPGTSFINPATCADEAGFLSWKIMA